ncbi:MAG: M14 family metallopeptidase, partial [Marinilabiliales bacterium]|nr:M14 family metallopeptidase [Marinilabiliales bacterium]
MRKILLLSVFLLQLLAGLSGQNVPSPLAHFGFSIGDNYRLATYSATEAYFRKVAAASDRVKLVDMGPTEEGRRQIMMVVSSPENIRNLDHYKEISMKLARAEQLTPADAEKLAQEGKAVVWIDGGLHATETVGTHQLIETLWQLVSRKDPETLRILDQVIVLLVHANPDGQEIVSNWYMREKDSLKRSLNRLPVLYQKYVGHDNNRDFYMLNMKESQNISRQLYIEWMPQILYNHHQAGPAGSVVAGPPYRDPFNYYFHPLVVTGIDAVGAAMVNRLNAEGKPGYTERGGSVFSTWYNGGLRTTAYFHNIIGLLTEIIGGPTPSTVPLVPARLLPNGNTPFPVMPQNWNFRKSIDYSVSLNYAVLDYAARNREHLLFNIYNMGRSAITTGSRDNWTVTAGRTESLLAAWRKDQGNKKAIADEDENGSMRNDTLPLRYYQRMLKDSTRRDPRGYVLPSDQPDFATAIKFVNALIRSGIVVKEATQPFSVDGRNFPVGSYVVQTDQAFRPHVLDMFEPQDHPNDLQYPGGPPVKPYDIAGWTPAFSMGIQFTRVLHGFAGPFRVLPFGEVQSPTHPLPSGGSGFLLSAQSDYSFTVVNDLLKAGITVRRVTQPKAKANQEIAGTFYVPDNAVARKLLGQAAREGWLTIRAARSKPDCLTGNIHPVKIGLWDTYGGSLS